MNHAMVFCFLQSMQDPSAGGVHDATSLALALGIASGACILLLPERYCMLPVVWVTCFIPLDGAVSAGGLHFSMLRLVVLFGWARILLGRGVAGFKWSRIDSAFVTWALVRLVTFSLLWQTSDALVNGLGYAYDAIGLYMLFRVVIRSVDDVNRIFRFFAMAFIPLALFMWTERMSGHDPFSLLGGVPETAMVRDGIVRAQGPFGHPILAGTFGAVWLPLLIYLWRNDRKHRLLTVLGIASATLITLAAGSSGPLGSYVAGIVGLSMWILRRHMRAVRWGILLSVLLLHLIMKDPVWFIFAHLDVLSGSTGWHRANLIDRTVANYSEWWMLGAKDVARWGVFAGDTTNQFVSEGVRGGIAVLLLFVYLIVAAYSKLGVALKRVRGRFPQRERFFWFLGAALFGHLVSFFGVSYFDQNVVNWYLLLAIVAGSTQWWGAGPAVVRDGRPAVQTMSSFSHLITPSFERSR